VPSAMSISTKSTRFSSASSRPSAPSWQLAMPLLVHMVLACGAHAEVYKWVDAQGQTHYSERKAASGGAKTESIKIASAPEVPTTGTPGADYLRAPSKFAQPPQPPVERPRGPPPSLSNGRENGTDASRCALARDIMSGAVRHTNGKETDQNDRDVAQSDIKMFCR
jgi:hypothetical protein